jgi:hypothetical protein
MHRCALHRFGSVRRRSGTSSRRSAKDADTSTDGLIYRVQTAAASGVRADDVVAAVDRHALVLASTAAAHLLESHHHQKQQSSQALASLTALVLVDAKASRRLDALRLHAYACSRSLQPRSLDSASGLLDGMLLGGIGVRPQLLAVIENILEADPRPEVAGSVLTACVVALAPPTVCKRAARWCLDAGVDPDRVATYLGEPDGVTVARHDHPKPTDRGTGRRHATTEAFRSVPVDRYLLQRLVSPGTEHKRPHALSILSAGVRLSPSARQQIAAQVTSKWLPVQSQSADVPTTPRTRRARVLARALHQIPDLADMWSSHAVWRDLYADPAFPPSARRLLLSAVAQRVLSTTADGGPLVVGPEVVAAEPILARCAASAAVVKLATGAPAGEEIELPPTAWDELPPMVALTALRFAGRTDLATALPALAPRLASRTWSPAALARAATAAPSVPYPPAFTAALAVLVAVHSTSLSAVRAACGAVCATAVESCLLALRLGSSGAGGGSSDDLALAVRGGISAIDHRFAAVHLRAPMTHVRIADAVLSGMARRFVGPSQTISRGAHRIVHYAKSRLCDLYVTATDIPAGWWRAREHPARRSAVLRVMMCEGATAAWLPFLTAAAVTALLPQLANDFALFSDAQRRDLGVPECEGRRQGNRVGGLATVGWAAVAEEATVSFRAGWRPQQPPPALLEKHCASSPDQVVPSHQSRPWFEVALQLGGTVGARSLRTLGDGEVSRLVRDAEESNEPHDEAVISLAVWLAAQYRSVELQSLADALAQNASLRDSTRKRVRRLAKATHVAHVLGTPLSD